MKQNPNQRRSRGRGMVRSGRSGGGRLTLVQDGQTVDVRARGAYTQAHEKYLLLAREAQSSGDRVAAESFYQYAEHYFRMLALIQAAENERRASEGVQNGGGYRARVQGSDVGSADHSGQEAAQGECETTDAACDAPEDEHGDAVHEGMASIDHDADAPCTVDGEVSLAVTGA